MNDVEVTPSAARPRRPVQLVILLIVIAAAIVVALIVFLRGRPAEWNPAAHLPKEVSLAITVDLTNTAEKDAAWDFIDGILKDAGVEDFEKEVFKDLNRELDIDVERDVLSRLNGTGGVALLTEMSGMIPGVSVVAGAKSDGDAEALVNLIIDRLKKAGARTTTQTYEGVSYYQISMQQYQLCLAALDSGVLFASGQGPFKKTIDAAKGGASLAQDQYFARYRQTSPSTFITTYFSGPNFYKLVGPFLAMGMGMAAPGAAESMKQYLEANVAVVGNGEATGDGLTFAIKGVTSEENILPELQSIDDLVTSIPKDAGLALSAQGIEQAMTEFRKRLQSDPAMKSQMQPVLDQMKQQFGIDLIPDVLDRLKALTMYWVARRPAKPGEAPGYFVFSFTVDKPVAVRRTVAKIHAIAAQSGMKFAQTSVEGRKVTIGTSATEDFRLGEVFVGNKLILTMSGQNFGEAVRGAMAAAGARGKGIADTDAFKLVKKQLPSKTSAVVFADVANIVGKFRADMSSEDRKVVDAVFKKVGPVGMTAESDRKVYGLQVAIPFKK